MTIKKPLAGLTQEQFATFLGITYAGINRWENERFNPSSMAMKLIEGMLKEMGDRGSDLLAKYFLKEQE